MALDRCVVLFTKPARPGRVKTRLIGDLSAEQAAELHAAFLGDLLERLAKGDFDLRIAWALEEGEEPPWSDPPGFAQEGETLSERLYYGLDLALRRHLMAAAIGSDHPTLARDHVERAFRELENGADVVLGPATDGGYYLIALRAPVLSTSLFQGISWSTDQVFAQTLERCRRLGLAVELLPAAADVDTPEDLAALAARLGGGGEDSPRTRRLLSLWGRLA